MSELRTPEALIKAAEAIKNKDLKANAMALIERMNTVIEGIGDKPVVWNPSFLKLVQATTDTTALPAGAAPGKLVLGESLVDSVDVFPLRLWTSRRMWSEDLDDSRSLCDSPDSVTGWRYGDCKKCSFATFDEVEKKSACSKQLQFINVAADLSDVFVCSFAKSQYRNGMEWEKLIRTTKTFPFKSKYTLKPGRHPEKKQIFLLEAHMTPRADYTVEPEVMKFIETLFHWVSDERSKGLASYYENIAARKEQLALEGGNGTAALSYVEGEEAGAITIIGDTSTDRPDEEEEVTYSV